MSGVEQVSVDKRLNQPTRYYVNGHETTAGAAVEALIKLSQTRERQAAARALREAADPCERSPLHLDQKVAEWLRWRADRIESGEL